MADSISILEQAMNVAAFRQRVLASNIANADTPGYKAKDISFQSELTRAIDGQGGAYNVYDTVPTMESRDGNTVNLDLEMAKVAETTLMHNSAALLLSTKFRMMKDVARGSSR